MAEIASVGTVYEIEIVEETSNEWTGPLGIAFIGDVAVPVPNAKKGERLKIKVTGVEPNPWTSRKEAHFVKES